MDAELVRRDPRVIANDSDRIVLKIQSRTRMHPAVLLGGSALLSAAVVAIVWWIGRPSISVWPLTVLWLVLASAGLFGMREGTLVALRRENALFVEWRNVLSRRRRRTLSARLSDLKAYEVRSVVDLETDSHLYELRLSVNHESAVWYCGSREAAEMIGQGLLRLRDAGASNKT